MRLPPQPLNDNQRRRACALLASGATRRSAAKFAGCRRLDLDAEIKFDPAFKLMVQQSELRPEIDTLRSLLEAARDPKQWRAAAWVLERFYPRRYGAQKREAIKPTELQAFQKYLDKYAAQALPAVLKSRHVRRRRRK